MDATDGDISAATATSITFRAMRWMGFLCNPPINGGLVQTPVLTMTMTNKRYYGIRGPAAGDSILIRYEGDEGTNKDDTWVLGKITGLTTVNCPGVPTYPDNTAGKSHDRCFREEDDLNVAIAGADCFHDTDLTTALQDSHQ